VSKHTIVDTRKLELSGLWALGYGGVVDRELSSHQKAPVHNPNHKVRILPSSLPNFFDVSKTGILGFAHRQ